jgi:hypothetical protein
LAGTQIASTATLARKSAGAADYYEGSAELAGDADSVRPAWAAAAALAGRLTAVLT